MKENAHDVILLSTTTAPKRLAEELLPLLSVPFLSESPASLRALVEPSATDLKLIELKLGATAASRVRESRQRILAELNQLLEQKGATP